MVFHWTDLSPASLCHHLVFHRMFSHQLVIYQLTCHQDTLSWDWSLIVVISLWWSLILMVFDQGDLSLRWLLFKVVSRDGGLSSGFSLTAGSLAPPLAETNDQPGVTKKNQHEES